MMFAVTAVTTAVLCLSLWGGRMPGQLLVAVMTAGLTVLVIGLVSRFEKQLCLFVVQPDGDVTAESLATSAAAEGDLASAGQGAREQKIRPLL